MTLKIPPHVTQHWHNEWYLSDAQIEALIYRFIADYRQRKLSEQSIEPPPQENDVEIERREQRVLEMAEMNKTMSQKQIADHFGLSQQRISQLFKQFGIKNIRHYKSDKRTPTKRQ